MPAVLVLTLACSVAACGAQPQPQPQPPGEPAPAAGEPVAAELFAPGRISDDRWQYRITFTPDGDVAYFTAADEFFPASRVSSIYRSHLQPDGRWAEPELAPFSGTYTDIDPFITPAGDRMYFSSIRPVNGEPREALDIFYMDRRGDGWSEPVRLGPAINTDLDELYPSVDAAGNIYFASGPQGPSPEVNWNIYMARPDGDGFQPRQPVDAVNTRRPWNPDNPVWDWQFNPEISADGNTLVFTSLRPGGFGFGDLYVSRRRDGQWSEPVNLGPEVNTEADEFHPTLSRDGRTLFFARTVFQPELVPSNFYTVPVAGLPGFE